MFEKVGQSETQKQEKAALENTDGKEEAIDYTAPMNETFDKLFGAREDVTH